MTESNRQVLLASRPEGKPTESNFRIKDGPVPNPGEGQVLVRNQVGDLLVTSGMGKWFPKGLPVAKVTNVTKRETGRDQEVEAQPTVSFSRLDAVLILVSPPPDDDKGDAKDPKDKPKPKP